MTVFYKNNKINSLSIEFVSRFATIARVGRCIVERLRMFPFKKNSVIVATVATTLSGIRLCNRMVHCSEERTQQKPQGPKFVAMFLSPDSQAVLGRFLDKQGMGALKGNRVVIRRLVEDNDSFAYQPLFGERAAFRLKGIVETENGIRSVSLARKCALDRFMNLILIVLFCRDMYGIRLLVEFP